MDGVKNIAKYLGSVRNDSETHETVLLDCTTGEARECRQSSNTSRVRFTVNSHTPGCARFYHIHIVSKRNWDGACLMNLTQGSYLFFSICNLFDCVAESWWNMPFKGTRHGDAMAYVIVVTLIRLFSIMTSCGLNTHCDVTRCMYGLWILINKRESPKGDS